VSSSLPALLNRLQPPPAHLVEPLRAVLEDRGGGRVRRPRRPRPPGPGGGAWPSAAATDLTGVRVRVAATSRASQEIWSAVRMCGGVHGRVHRARGATLAYVYAESRGRRSAREVAEPHSYDLCSAHGRRLTVPRGWDVVRIRGGYAACHPLPGRAHGWPEAVREAGRAVQAANPPTPWEPPPPAHLRTLTRPAHPRIGPDQGRRTVE